jgi:hypothetical protein
MLNDSLPRRFGERQSTATDLLLSQIKSNNKSVACQEKNPKKRPTIHVWCAIFLEFDGPLPLAVRYAKSRVVIPTKLKCPFVRVIMAPPDEVQFWLHSVLLYASALAYSTEALLATTGGTGLGAFGRTACWRKADELN